MRGVPSVRKWLLRGLVLPAGDRLFGQQMIARLRHLEEAQWWDPERVAAARDAAARRLVETAYTEVPFWRAHLDAAGVSPAEIRSTADLGRIPPVGKPEMRAAFPHGLTRPTGQRTYPASTSGSTGVNFQVMEDAATAGWYRASTLLALEWAGWEIGTPHLQMGMTLNRSPERRLKDLMLHCFYTSAFDLRPEVLDQTLETLERHRIRFAFGYPGSLYVLAQRARETGWNLPLTAVTWGDMLYPHYRREIEAAFGTRVHDTYGLGEGVQIAAQCGHDGSYHLHMLDAVVDLLDAKGRPVDSGATGEVVVTRLHPGPMPLIRYRVGDLAAAADQGPTCGCGRRWERLGGIQGRDTDMVVTPSGNRLIVHFFTGILEHFPEIDSFQVVQEEASAILLRVVPRPDFSAEVTGRVIRALRDKGADLEIEVQTVSEIPLPPTGKRRFVVSPYARSLRDAHTTPDTVGVS
jgi:phenylacetate-CoA ligase